MKPYLRRALIASCLAATFQIAAGAAAYRVVAYATTQNGEPISIAEGATGLFYVIASSNIASVTAKGVETTLSSFTDPPYTLESSPVSAANGFVYSSVVQINGKSSFANVFSVGSTALSERTYPAQTLSPVLAGNLPDGGLFGLAYLAAGGPFDLAAVDLAGTVKTFYQFGATERPNKPIYGADGNYYGTSEASGDGTAYLYQATSSGSFTKVAALPFVITSFLGGGTILQGTDGNFYGIQSTALGCAASNQHGGVYKLTPAGQYTLLHDFGVCTNGVVNALIEGSDGKLYGATQGSVLFSLTTAGEYTVLFQTTNGVTQGLCQCTIVQGSDGVIYGTANGGGPNGLGLIFALDAGLPIPKPQAREFSPQSGSVATKVRIWGYNLLQSSVAFNGVPATEVASSGPNYVWATVPQGASTGPITITTAGGTSVTAANFSVE